MRVWTPQRRARFFYNYSEQQSGKKDQPCDSVHVHPDQLVAKLKDRNFRPHQQQCAPPEDYVEAPFASSNTLPAGMVCYHPDFGRGALFHGPEDRRQKAWIEFPDGVQILSDIKDITLFAPRKDSATPPHIPPDKLVKDTLEQNDDYTDPFLFYGGRLYMFVQPCAIGGSQLYTSFRRSSLARYTQRIKREGFSMNIAIPVYWLKDLKNIVATDGHHRVRSAGRAIASNRASTSDKGWLCLAGSRTNRIPVFFIGANELFEHAGDRDLTDDKLAEDFIAASHSFARVRAKKSTTQDCSRVLQRAFRNFDFPEIRTFYSVPTTLLLNLSEALFCSPEYGYYLPHAGVCSAGIPESKTSELNQDGFARFLDAEMGFNMAVMDGLGLCEDSETAVHIAGHVFVESMQREAHVLKAIQNVNSTVCESNLDDDKDSATTFASVRITRTPEKITAETANVGDSYNMIFRKNHEGRYVRMFLAEQHTRLVDEDPKLQLTDLVITSSIGEEKIEISHDYHDLQVGDICFLCTDGVTKFVKIYEIAKLLDQHNNDLNAFINALRNLVIERQKEKVQCESFSSQDKGKTYIRKEVESCDPDHFTFGVVRIDPFSST